MTGFKFESMGNDSFTKNKKNDFVKVLWLKKIYYFVKSVKRKFKLYRSPSSLGFYEKKSI